MLWPVVAARVPTSRSPWASSHRMCSRTVADSRANIEAVSCSRADRGAVVAVAGIVGTTFPFGDTCQADSSVTLVQAFDCLGCFGCTGVGAGGVARRSVWVGGGPVDEG